MLKNEYILRQLAIPGYSTQMYLLSINVTICFFITACDN